MATRSDIKVEGDERRGVRRKWSVLGMKIALLTGFVAVLAMAGRALTATGGAEASVTFPFESLMTAKLAIAPIAIIVGIGCVIVERSRNNGG